MSNKGQCSSSEVSCCTLLCILSVSLFSPSSLFCFFFLSLLLYRLCEMQPLRMRENTTSEGVAHHLISGMGAGLTSSTQTSQGVEHTRAAETHEGDHAQLERGRGIPGDLAPAFVHPSPGKLIGSPGFIDDRVSNSLVFGVDCDGLLDSSVGHVVVVGFRWRTDSFFRCLDKDVRILMADWE